MKPILFGFAKFLVLFGISTHLSLQMPQALASIKPEAIHVAEAKKTRKYIRDGMIIGGDRAITDVVITGIRRASNSGYERIVIDLDSTIKGKEPGIPRSPYYQFSISPESKEITFHLWGRPKLLFNAQKVVAQLKRSPIIEDAILYPRIEDELWTLVIKLKGDSALEVFELSTPTRIIMDLEANPKT